MGDDLKENFIEIEFRHIRENPIILNFEKMIKKVAEVHEHEGTPNGTFVPVS